MAGELIGALRVTLAADTSNFTSGMKKARSESATASAAIARNVSTISTAVKGFAAGFIVQQFVSLAQRGLEYASSLGEVAQQLGVTTRDLQEYRYAASQVGIAQDEMDKGLKTLTATMGAARNGAAAPVAAFKTLSDLLGRDILKSAQTAGDAIPMIADAMRKVEDPTRKAALAAEVFGGKLGGKFLTLLDGGSEAVNGLRDAAQKLGIVLSDEQIANADTTADKLAALKTVLEANIAGAVANNADAILSLASALGTLIANLGNATRAWAIWKAVQGAQSNDEGVAQKSMLALAATKDGRAAALNNLDQRIRKNQEARTSGIGRVRTGADTSIIRRSSPRDVANNDREFKALVRQRNALLKIDVAPAIASPTINRAPTPGGGSGAGAGGGGGSKPKRGGGGGGGGASRDTSARDAYRSDREALREQMDVLDAQRDLTADIKERGVIAQQRIALERRGADLEVAHNLQSGDITAAQAARTRASNDLVFTLQAQAQRQDEAYDLQREQIGLRKGIESLASDQLQGEAALARTAAERREVEMRILAAKYASLRQAQQDVLDDARSSVEERTLAGRTLLTLDKRQVQDTEQTKRGTAGPLEDYRDSLPQTAAQINEALESIQVRGLQSLNDGIVDAIMGAKSLGDVFKNVAKSIIADLLRIAVQKAITEPLANALFDGGGGGGGGGIFSAIGRALGGLGKREFGGPVRAGVPYIVGERRAEVFIPDMNGSIAPSFGAAAAQLSSPMMSAGRAGAGVSVTINAPGATAETVSMIRREIAMSAPAIVQAAKGETVRTLQRGRM